MTDFDWLSITDAVRCLGVSDDTIRRRIKDGQIKYRRDNKGRYSVLVPMQPQQVLTQECGHTPTEPPQAPPQNTYAGANSEEDTLRYHLDLAERRREGDLARAEERHSAELVRIGTLHMNHIERLLSQSAAERSLWLERVDAAELRAERVENRLDQVLDQLLQFRQQPAPPEKIACHEPWWRHLFGKSRKSEI